MTVTDPNATRFFMTTEEAVLLVLQAGALGEGGDGQSDDENDGAACTHGALLFFARQPPRGL